MKFDQVLLTTWQWQESSPSVAGGNTDCAEQTSKPGCSTPAWSHVSSHYQARRSLTVSIPTALHWNHLVTRLGGSQYKTVCLTTAYNKLTYFSCFHLDQGFSDIYHTKHGSCSPITNTPCFLQAAFIQQLNALTTKVFKQFLFSAAAHSPDLNQGLRSCCSQRGQCRCRKQWLCRSHTAKSWSRTRWQS